MSSGHSTQDDRPARDCPNEADDAGNGRKYAATVKEGLRLHGGRNLFQAVALLAFAAVGAITGYSLTDDRPDLAALVGGVLGAILGTFLSGFVLMFVSPPASMFTLSEIRRKYRRAKHRLIVFAVAFVLFVLTMPLIISRFGHDDSNFAWLICLFWICITCGLCLYTKMLAYRLREWKCPNCGERFGKLWSRCAHCGLPINDVTERKDAI